MKVLFVGKLNSRGSDGGSHTFINTVLAGIENITSVHKFYYVEPNVAKNPIKKVVENNEIDLVWFLTPYYEETGAPFVVTVWDLAHRFAPFFPEVSLTGWTFDQREQFYRYVLPRATFVVTGNMIGAKHIHEFYGVPETNIKTIPLPVNRFSGFKANPSVIVAHNLEVYKYIFYPAQFWPHKNHVSVIDAFAIAKQSEKDLKLVFTGSDKGNLRFVKNYAENLNISKDVLFLGFVEIDVIHQLYTHAFVHVFGSCIGPDNIPPLEAMVFDCPTVCAEFEGAREQLGDAVLYFSPLNSVQAANAIIELKSPLVRNLLQEKGRELIKNLDAASYCCRIKNIIDDFVGYRRLWSSGSEYKHL